MKPCAPVSPPVTVSRVSSLRSKHVSRTPEAASLARRSSRIWAALALACLALRPGLRGGTCGPWDSEVCLPQYVQQITHSSWPPFGGTPSINAAGGIVVFNSTQDLTGGNPDQNSEIFVYFTESQVFYQLTMTVTPAINSHPVITADSQHVLFLSNDELDPATGAGHDNPDGSYEIFRVRTPDFWQIPGNPLVGMYIPIFQQVTDSKADVAPFISVNDDGTRVAFWSDGDYAGANADANHEVFLADLSALPFVFEQITDTQQDRSFGKQVSRFPRINGDGTRISLISTTDQGGCNPDRGLELFLYDTLTASFHQITDGSGQYVAVTHSIDASGDLVAFTADPGVGHVELLVYDHTKSDPSVCDPTPAITRITYTQPAPINDTLAIPEISADGTRIAFLSTRAIQGCNPPGFTELFLADIAPITDPQFAQISSPANPLITAEEEARHPAINRDGTRIAFAYSDGAGPSPINSSILTYQLFLARCDQVDSSSSSWKEPPPDTAR